MENGKTDKRKCLICILSVFVFLWLAPKCPEQESNLHASRHAHLKRARLPFRHLGKKRDSMLWHLEPRLSGKRDSNSRPQPWQGCALPTELFPPDIVVKRRRLELPRLAALPPQSSASTNSATSPTNVSFFIKFGFPDGSPGTLLP